MFEDNLAVAAAGVGLVFLTNEVGSFQSEGPTHNQWSEKEATSYKYWKSTAYILNNGLWKLILCVLM